MKRLVKLSLLLLPFLAMGQDIPIGTWRSHHSYHQAQILALANETLFCAAENGLFVLDLNSLETRKLTKEGGMGDAGVTAMHFDAAAQKMIIGYASGVVDVIDDEGNIQTLTTLRDSPVVADKDIRDITSAEGSAFLATGFGVVRLNLTNNTFTDNYRNIGEAGAQLSVSEVAFSGDSLYVVSDAGIQAGALADNLLDFNEWERFAETNGLSFSLIGRQENRLVALHNQSELWAYDGEEWSATGTVFPESIVAFTAGVPDRVLAATSVYDFSANPLLTDALLVDGKDLLTIGQTVWIADGSNGLLRLDETTTQHSPKGPLNDQPTRLRVINNRAYALFGLRPPFHTGAEDGLGYSVFANGQWQTQTIEDFFNITDVEAVGENLFFASMGYGLYDQAQDQILNADNSPLPDHLSSLRSYNGQLWAISYNTSGILHQRSADGQWSSFSPAQTGFNLPLDFSLSPFGVIWARRSTLEGGGVGIFDPITSQARTMGTADGLPSSAVTGIAIDTDDLAWIGTSNGLASYLGASFPFNSFGVSEPIFQNQVLLDDRQINDVMTDGGNRLWVATNSGVWVFQNDLAGMAHRFTRANSPLPSDIVLSLAYAPASGEVFIRTDRGLVSFRSASSAAGSTHESTIKVFPNPVKANFSGTVGISGLAQNANIKITDISGRVVTEIQANGGTAGWNLEAHGSRVQPGIYLIFSSSADGQETMVGKIAVIP